MNDATRNVLTRDQIRRVDRLAVTQFKMPSIVLMENAGKNAADWMRRRYDRPSGAVNVFCGTGNNGGDGFVVGRHLHNAGWKVRFLLCGDREKLSDDARTNHDIVAATGLPVSIVTESQEFRRVCAALRKNDIIVDALFGTGFSGAVREPLAEAIRAVNDADVQAVVAIDVPSGLDCETGEVTNVAVKADATITFVAVKRGFESGAASGYLGEIVVVDIGTPPSVIDRAITTTSDG